MKGENEMFDYSTKINKISKIYPDFICPTCHNWFTEIGEQTSFKELLFIKNNCKNCQNNYHPINDYYISQDNFVDKNTDLARTQIEKLRNYVINKFQMNENLVNKTIHEILEDNLLSDKYKNNIIPILKKAYTNNLLRNIQSYQANHFILIHKVKDNDFSTNNLDLLDLDKNYYFNCSATSIHQKVLKLLSYFEYEHITRLHWKRPYNYRLYCSSENLLENILLILHDFRVLYYCTINKEKENYYILKILNFNRESNEPLEETNISVKLKYPPINVIQLYNDNICILQNDQLIIYDIENLNPLYTFPSQKFSSCYLCDFSNGNLLWYLGYSFLLWKQVSSNEYKLIHIQQTAFYDNFIVYQFSKNKFIYRDSNTLISVFNLNSLSIDFNITLSKKDKKHYVQLFHQNKLLIAPKDEEICFIYDLHEKQYIQTITGISKITRFFTCTCSFKYHIFEFQELVNGNFVVFSGELVKKFKGETFEENGYKEINFGEQYEEDKKQFCFLPDHRFIICKKPYIYNFSYCESESIQDKISEEMNSPEIGLLKCFVENEIIIFCQKKQYYLMY